MQKGDDLLSTSPVGGPDTEPQLRAVLAEQAGAGGISPHEAGLGTRELADGAAGDGDAVKPTPPAAPTRPPYALPTPSPTTSARIRALPRRGCGPRRRIVSKWTIVHVEGGIGAMATRDEDRRERTAEEPHDAASEDRRDEPRDTAPDTSPDSRDPGAHDTGGDYDNVTPSGDDVTTVTDADGTLTVTTGGGASDWITTDGEPHDAGEGDADAGDPDADATDTDDPAGLDLASATMPGGPQDHLGMRVEEDHIPDLDGHRALVDGGALTGSAAGDLAQLSPTFGTLGYDPGTVGSSPRDDERTIDQDDGPFSQTQDPFAGFDQVASRPGSLYDNPNVVGADREAEALAAADPDLTGLVDIDGIAGGQVGGTIDGRSPDGGEGGNTSGFVATSGYDPGNLLDGATSQGLTNPFAAAAAVQQGVQDFGHDGFVVYDLHTGAAVYGPGVSAGNGPSIPAGSGPAGNYVIVENGAEYDGGQLAPSSTSPLSTPVKTGGSEGVVPQGGESAHADEPWFQKFADWVMQGSPTSPKAEALQQATDEIDAQGAPPPPPDPPNEGPEVEMPADPDAGGPPPPGLDLSREWAISVWARQNADVNPNPMGEGMSGGSAQAMDISEVVEQYDEAPLAPPTIDPEAQIGPDISEQFTEFDG